MAANLTKRILLPLVLAVSAMAQQTCIDFRLETLTHAASLHFHSLHAVGWRHAELLPTANGVGLLLFYYMPEYSMWYADQHTWQEDVPGCERLQFQTVAMWWDDRDNQPRNDIMTIGAGRQVPLSAMPVGMTWSTTISPLSLEPRVERQREPWHWNSSCYRPLHWAVLIVPTRGWW